MAALGAPHPALFRGILHVVLARPQKQVRRVDAWGIVAVVTDLQPIGNGADIQHE